VSGSDEELPFAWTSTVERGSYELQEGGDLSRFYQREPPEWFTKHFFNATNSSANAYRIASVAAGVVAEAVVRRFESVFAKWVDKRIQRRIDEHVKDRHG
jgi:hypothetical protein